MKSSQQSVVSSQQIVPPSAPPEGGRYSADYCLLTTDYSTQGVSHD